MHRKMAKRETRQDRTYLHFILTPVEDRFIIR